MAAQVQGDGVGERARLDRGERAVLRRPLPRPVAVDRAAHQPAVPEREVAPALAAGDVVATLGGDEPVVQVGRQLLRAAPVGGERLGGRPQVLQRAALQSQHPVPQRPLSRGGRRAEGGVLRGGGGVHRAADGAAAHHRARGVRLLELLAGGAGEARRQGDEGRARRLRLHRPDLLEGTGDVARGVSGRVGGQLTTQCGGGEVVPGERHAHHASARWGASPPPAASRHVGSAVDVDDLAHHEAGLR